MRADLNGFLCPLNYANTRCFERLSVKKSLSDFPSLRPGPLLIFFVNAGMGSWLLVLMIVNDNKVTFCCEGYCFLLYFLNELF